MGQQANRAGQALPLRAVPIMEGKRRSLAYDVRETLEPLAAVDVPATSDLFENWLVEMAHDDCVMPDGELLLRVFTIFGLEHL